MQDFLIAAIAALLAVIGYFVKQILDRTLTIGDDVSDMKPKVNILWQDKFAPASSPRKLNERGASVLQESGIKEIIDDKRQDLLAAVRGVATKNAYDAEMAILATVQDIPEQYPELLERIKNGAFKTGTSIETILFVGGLYLRDLIFPELGFSLDEVDRHEPAKPKQ
jgi:hypothetical protein